MKIFYFSIISLIGLGVLSSCKDSGSSGGINSSIQDIFPLTTGNHWTYHLTEFLNTGTIRSESSYDVLIRSNQTFQGMLAFEYSLQGDTSGKMLIYYLGTSDVYTVRNSTSFFHALHYPMNVGETFVIKDTTDSGGNIQKEIFILRGASEPISVKAGSFTCLHFDRIAISGNSAKQDTNSIQKMYYASGKGMIEEDDYFYDSNNQQYKRYSLQLESIDLK